jgi:hypothetical protein
MKPQQALITARVFTRRNLPRTNICSHFSIIKRTQVLNHLSGTDLKQYHEDGFIVPSFRLSPEKLHQAQSALEQLLADNPSISPELLVNSHLEDSNSVAEGVRGNKFFLELASSPEIVDMVAQCLGSNNVILWACQIFCKPPLIGKSVPYHQDGTYWPIKPLNAVSAWIALDDSNVSTGNVNFIKGSHKYGIIDHVEQIDSDACINYVADPAVVSKLSDSRGISSGKGVVTSVELKAGEMSLHHSMVVHGSGVNRSSKRRAGIAATFMAVSF